MLRHKLLLQSTLNVANPAFGIRASLFRPAGCDFLHNLVIPVFDFLLPALAHGPLEDGLYLFEQDAIGPFDFGVLSFLDAVHFLA